MSITVLQDAATQQPVFTTLARLAIERLGEHPGLTLVWHDTVPVLEPWCVVAATSDANANGLFEQFSAPELVDAPSAVGRDAYVTAGPLAVPQHIGRVLTHNTVNGTVTVSAGLPSGAEGQVVRLQQHNAFGQGVCVAASGGRRWEYTLTAATHQVRLQQMLGAVFVKAILAAAVALDLAVSPEDAAAAVAELAAAGISLDTILVEEAEALEVERYDGALVGVYPIGQAPKGY